MTISVAFEIKYFIYMYVHMYLVFTQINILKQNKYKQVQTVLM